LRAGCEMCRRRAARVTFPSSATVEKYSRRFSVKSDICFSYENHQITVLDLSYRPFESGEQVESSSVERKANHDSLAPRPDHCRTVFPPYPLHWVSNRSAHQKC